MQCLPLGRFEYILQCNRDWLIMASCLYKVDFVDTIHSQRISALQRMLFFVLILGANKEEVQLSTTTFAHGAYLPMGTENMLFDLIGSRALHGRLGKRSLLSFHDIIAIEVFVCGEALIHE